MWRKVMMFLFTATVAAGAQAISSPEQPQAADKFQGEKFQMPEVRVVQRHDKLRRDRDEKIVIFPVIPQSKFQTCLASTQSTPCLFLVSLQLEPTEGFRFRYSDGSNFKAQLKANAVVTKGGNVFLLQ